MQPLRLKLYQKIGAEDYVATPKLTRTFLNIVREDSTESMPKITAPTLIIWGENDQETPLEQGRKINSLISNSKFLILSRAGHYSFLDKTGQFTKELEKFLKG
jgi:pimeloyl-ACP methyl ester carboxylesterase